MSTQISRLQDLNLIAAIIALHTYGLGIRDLQLQLKKQGRVLSLRTLQRRLEILLSTQRIALFGSGKATLYYQPQDPLFVAQDLPRYEIDDVAMHPLISEDPVNAYLPLSCAGRMARNEVRQALLHGPLFLQQPYHAEFLEKYSPNSDFYLSSEIRENLHSLGQSSFEKSGPGQQADYLHTLLLMDFSWAASRLAGHSITRLEAARFMQYGQLPKHCSSVEIQLLLNYQTAFSSLVQQTRLQASDLGWNLHTVCNFHAILTHNLRHNNQDQYAETTPPASLADAAHLRKNPQVLVQITKFFQKITVIADAYEQAFFCLLHLPYLSPFLQGNQGLAQLLLNLPLIQRNLCPCTFLEISAEIYAEAQQAVVLLQNTALLRDMFVWAYEQTVRRYLSKEPIKRTHVVLFEYRTAIMLCIQAIVLHNLPITQENILRFASNDIAPEHSEIFVKIVQQELRKLYPGNILRYRIQAQEFVHWHAKQNTVTL